MREEEKTKAQRINDKVFNTLIEDGRYHKNELFAFWDIFRTCYGECSCIDNHHIIAGQILCEIHNEDAKKGVDVE